MALSINNFVRVSVLSALRGLADINTSALAIITDEAPIPNDFGTFRTYLDPTGVAQDFGSNSDTFRLATVVFSQQQNILTGGGFLLVVPREAAASAQPAVITGSNAVNLTTLTATDYNIRAAMGASPAADILIGTVDSTSISTAQTSLNSAAVTAAGLQFVVSGQDVASAVVTLQTTGTGATTSITLSAATTGTDISPLLNLSGSATGADAGLERVKDAILRTVASVPYFGVILNTKESDANITELSATVQALNIMLGVGSNLTADISGVFTTLLNSGYTRTRYVLHTDSENTALDFCAAYMSYGMSVNYDGAGTQLTMHGKTLTGIVGDEGVSQTILDQAGAAGCDVYGDFGVPKVFTSGANQYFDQAYSRLALQLRLQTAGFNFLTTTNTKIPQTEEGLNGLKSAYRSIMDIFVANGTYAPGTWTGSTTFGDPADHIRNIAEFGYFIFSQPISQQSQAQRNARVAPLVQIAAKEAGAIHSSDVVVLVEA